jgi:hypothetical protein
MLKENAERVQAVQRFGRLTMTGSIFRSDPVHYAHDRASRRKVACPLYDDSL